MEWLCCITHATHRKKRMDNGTTIQDNFHLDAEVKGGKSPRIAHARALRTFPSSSLVSGLPRMRPALRLPPGFLPVT